MAKDRRIHSVEETENYLHHNDISQSSYKGGDMEIEIPRGAEEYQNWNGDTVEQSKVVGKQSVFNKYYVFRNPDNVYTDEDFAQKRWRLNPTAADLIRNGVGAQKYDVSDFVYMKKFGELPMNRLITLRRFSYPVSDNITSVFQKEPDIARLLTFFDQETNQLENLFNMTFGVRWKELTSTMEQSHTIGDKAGIGGFMKRIMSVTDPSFGDNALRGENELNYNPIHDSNATHGPVDSIVNTHIRDLGLHFDQPIELKFEFEAKSIDGNNPKAAMIDLIANIMQCCTNDAKFWGGARFHLGSPRPSALGVNMRKMGNAEYSKFLTDNGSDLKTHIASAAENLFSMDNIKNIAENLGKLAMGKLIDKIGRPSIVVMNSLLSGEPVGEWHLTIGNPFNPQMTIGNLIMESSTLSVPDGKLGIDGFPTAITLTCTLKHAMARDRAGIMNMFTGGEGRVYFRPTEEERQELHGGSRTPQSLADTTLQNGIKDAIKNLYSFAQTKFS